MNPDSVNNAPLLEAIEEMNRTQTRQSREKVLDLIITEGRFLAPVTILPGSGQSQDVRFDLLPNQQGLAFFPAFTGWEELRKLCGPKNQQTLLLDFDRYAAMILQDNRAAGLVIDPFGCCLSFEKEMLTRLVERKQTASFTK